MSLFIQNNHGTINHIENSTVTIHNGQSTMQQTEDITPELATADSYLFTKKAKNEVKVADITHALQQSFAGRSDKARALVEEVRQWQKDGYLDANFNARVMYDELSKIITMPFSYDGFRKYYNE